MFPALSAGADAGGDARPRTLLRRGYCDTAIGQVHYGQGGEGANLLLLGGVGRSMSVFATLLPLLLPRYRVWTIDLPGSGGSDPLPVEAGFGEIAAAVIEVMDGLGISSTSVYGLHTGNKIGAAMAAQWPRRVDRFIFAGQSHSIVPDNARRNQVIQAHMPLATPQGDAAAQALSDWAKRFQAIAGLWWQDGIAGHLLDPASRARLVAEICDELQVHDSKAGMYRANFAYDLAGDLARIDVPTLVLEIASAAEDAEVGRQGSVLSRLIPGAVAVETIMIADRFGVTLEDRAEDVAAVIRRFIK